MLFIEKSLINFINSVVLPGILHMRTDSVHQVGIGYAPQPDHRVNRVGTFQFQVH